MGKLFSLLDIFLPFLMGVTHVTIFCQSIVMFSILLQGDNVYCKSMKYRDGLPIVL